MTTIIIKLKVICHNTSKDRGAAYSIYDFLTMNQTIVII